MDHCDVAIIGAGPYGLSIAAHLKEAGVDFRVFGTPMEFWKNHMPKGMHLKSEGFASSLYDPGGRLPLRAYCMERGLEYEDSGRPVPLEVFTNYGLQFQKEFLPEVEDMKVARLEKVAGGFALGLADGRSVVARRVVVAVGLAYYVHMPEEFANLPAEVVTHSSQHGSLEQFRGREVVVIGAGASAIDLAALLHKHGTSVQVVARGPEFRFQDPPNPRRKFILDSLLQPATGIGSGWKLYLCANLPLLFRRMPAKFRIDRVNRTLGPAPCWFTREQVVGKIALHTGLSLSSASVREGKVHLELRDSAGAERAICADHVIAATGYRPDVRRIRFLDPAIAANIDCVGQSPALSAHFESSVPGLYFVGVSAANTFGPLLRFAFGAKFAAPHIARHLARTAAARTEAATVDRAGAFDSGSTESALR
jgi:thioredoxin reductase